MTSAFSGIKRAYTSVTVTEGEDGWRVYLDGRALRTPAGQELRLPSEALARAVAAEWAGQGGRVQPGTMPLTALANQALDHGEKEAEKLRAELLAYAATDLLCYRAEAPAKLVARQERLWQPVLDWLAETYGARLRVGTGVMPLTHPEESLAALQRLLAGLGAFPLTGLRSLAGCCGSVTLGLAVRAGYLLLEEALIAAELDEAFQNELWGEDAEAMASRASTRADAVSAARFLELL